MMNKMSAIRMVLLILGLIIQNVVAIRAQAQSQERAVQVTLPDSISASTRGKVYSNLFQEPG